MIAKLRAALTLLTVIPARGRLPAENEIADSMFFYPLIGALIGLVLAAFFALLSSHLPAIVAGLLITLLWALITGGFHLDGVADTCDGLFSARSREKALEIMKDSRIGTMGAIGLFGILSGKTISLGQFEDATAALVAAGLLGRWSMVLAATTSQYARPEGGMGANFIKPRPGLRLTSSIWLVPFFFLFDPTRFALALAIAALFTLSAKALLTRKLGGLTGDCLGAIGEGVELIVLIVYSATVMAR